MVTRAYRTSERTAATKHGGIYDNSLRRNKDSVSTIRPVANAVGLHFVDTLMNAFTTQLFLLRSQTGVLATTVHNDGLESTGTRAADNMDTTAEVTLDSEDSVNQMVVTRSQSAKLRRHQELQQQRQQERHREVQEAEEVTKDVEVMMTTNPYPRGRTIKVVTRRFLARVSFDGVSPTDFKRIALIPWFDRRAVLANSEAEFSSLSRYAWDNDFFGMWASKHSHHVFGNASSPSMMLIWAFLARLMLNVRDTFLLFLRVCKRSQVGNRSNWMSTSTYGGIAYIANFRTLLVCVR